MEEIFSNLVTVDSIDIRLEDMTNDRVGELIIWMEKENRDFKKLREIDLGNNTIEGPDLGKVAELLTKANKADDFDIRANKIGKEGIYCLQESLINMTNIKILSLDSCSLWDYGAEVAANCAEQMPSLQTLRLVDNFITDVGAKNIASLISKNTPLRELYIDYNKIGDVGVAHIVSALPKNKNIKLIGLGDNSITCEGCSAISEFFKLSKGGVIHMDLSVNDIEERGADILSEGLAHNTTLRSLDMGANPLLSMGAAAMCKFLSTNNTMRKLDLTNLHMGDEATDSICESIKNNKTIIDIVMLLNEEMQMVNKEKIAVTYFANRERLEEMKKLQQEKSSKFTPAFIITVVVVVVAVFMNFYL